MPRLVRNSRDLELILAVERQRAVDQQAADRAERQALDVAVLRRVLPHAEQLADRRRARVAERQRADALGRGEIAFEQHRRDAEHVGVVVEAGARIVGRQQRRDVDLERQQIANRVGVLGAVQPVRQRPARIRRRRARRDRASSRATRPAPCALAASGRGMPAGGIMPRAHLADHLLPDVGVRGDVGDAGAIERQARRSSAAWL